MVVVSFCKLMKVVGSVESERKKYNDSPKKMKKHMHKKIQKIRLQIYFESGGLQLINISHLICGLDFWKQLISIDKHMIYEHRKKAHNAYHVMLLYFWVIHIYLRKEYNFLNMMRYWRLTRYIIFSNRFPCTRRNTS